MKKLSVLDVAICVSFLSATRRVWAGEEDGDRNKMAANRRRHLGTSADAAWHHS